MLSCILYTVLSKAYSIIFVVNYYFCGIFDATFVAFCNSSLLIIYVSERVKTLSVMYRVCPMF